MVPRGDIPHPMNTKRFTLRVAAFGQSIGINQQCVVRLESEMMNRETSVAEQAGRKSGSSLGRDAGLVQVQKWVMSGIDELDRRISRRSAGGVL
jgi:hypothetical protein